MADQETVAVATKKKPTEAERKLVTKLARELHRLDFTPASDSVEKGATSHEERKKSFASQRTVYARQGAPLDASP